MDFANAGIFRLTRKIYSIGLLLFLQRKKVMVLLVNHGITLVRKLHHTYDLF